MPQMNPLLTQAHAPEMAAMINATPKGAAHWAGTGPCDKTCRECIFMFAEVRARRKKGHLVSRTCFKRERLSGARASVVPHDTPACRYFEQNENPPPAFAVKRKKKKA